MGGPAVLRVATRCLTVDDFVAAFATLVDEDTIVVVSDKVRPVGMRRRIAFELADGSPVLRGEAEIVDATPPPRPRLRLRFLLLDAASRAVHERMLARATGRTPREVIQRPVVRIPDAAGSGSMRAFDQPTPAGGLPAIPAVPPRILPTGALRADEIVTDRNEALPPPEPARVPEDRRTQRMYGLVPPPRSPPAFELAAAEPRDTIRMEPLQPPREHDDISGMVECRLYDDPDRDD